MSLACNRYGLQRGMNLGSLVIQQKGKPPRSFELVRHTTVIGRGKDCSLILPDISVSRHHAQVVREEDGFTLQDLGSQNGTSVNASPISSRKLETGDVIQIGKFVLVYRPKPKRAEERDDTKGLDDYQLDGRTSYLEQVTALGGSNAHQTAQIEKQDLNSIREAITRKERGSLVDPENPENRWVIGETAKQFGPAIPCGGLRGGTVVVVWSGRTHRIVKKSGLFTTIKVNGRQVKEKNLEPGDLIEVGRNQFRYEA